VSLISNCEDSALANFFDVFHGLAVGMSLRGGDKKMLGIKLARVIRFAID
jgi:hypothetical protein